MAKEIRPLKRKNPSTGQEEIFYPATTTDAVVDPNSRQSVTQKLSELDSYLLSKSNLGAKDVPIGSWKNVGFEYPFAIGSVYTLHFKGVDSDPFYFVLSSNGNDQIDGAIDGNTGSGDIAGDTFTFACTAENCNYLRMFWRNSSAEKNVSVIVSSGKDIKQKVDEMYGDEYVRYKISSDEKYVNRSGTISTGGGGCYTKPILLHPNESIVATCKGYSTNVAIISEVVTEDEAYNVLVLSTDDIIRSYTYTNSGIADKHVAISFLKSGGLVAGIKKEGGAVVSIRFDNTEQHKLLSPVVQVADMLPLVKDWGFIGDSLNSGEIYYNINGNRYNKDFYEYSWGQAICNLCRTQGTNFSVGGLTAKTWIQRYWDGSGTGYKSGGGSEGFKSNKKPVYTICLGTNEVNQSYPIGSWSDVKDNYANNADSFYGNYAGIVQRIRSIQPNARIFLITIPSIWHSRAETSGINDAIRSIAAKFNNVFLIDLAENCPSNQNIIDNYVYWGHMTAMGYQWIAYVIANLINECIRNNFESFKALPFIGGEYDKGSFE